MSAIRPAWRVFAFCAALAVASTDSVLAQPLDPLDFASLGTLNLVGGTSPPIPKP